MLLWDLEFLITAQAIFQNSQFGAPALQIHYFGKKSSELTQGIFVGISV
jgi:hypothetical protein